MKKVSIKSLFIATVLLFGINGCNNENTSSDTHLKGNTDERTDFRHIAESSNARWLHYFREGNYQNSLERLDLALELVELRDLHQIVEYYNRTGYLHGRLGNYELSNFYLDKALEMEQIDNDAPARLRALRNFVALHASGKDTALLETTMDISVVRDLLLIKQHETEQRNNTLLAQKTEDARRKWNLVLILTTVFGLVLALAIVGILFYRNKERETAITVRHYEELLKLKKEIQPQQVDVEKVDASDKLAFELQQLFETEKIYRQQGLNVDDVVKRLNTNSKYLSNVVRQHYGKNFTGYVNTFRVEEAIEILKQQQEKGNKYANYTIQAIAEEVGFNGKSSFYLAFNQIIGVAPLEYINVLKAETESKNTEIETENENTV